MITTLLLLAASNPITIPLTADLRRYDFAGTMERKAMYSPSSVKLESTAPAGLNLGPAKAANLKFASVTVGNAPDAKFKVVLDSDTDALWIDLNQDNKLTFDEKAKVESSAANEHKTTVQFRGSYVSGATKWRQPYALNFFWKSGSTILSFYRATAMTGSVLVNGKRLEVELIESNNSGVFHERFDTAKDPFSLRPISLLLNGKRVDPRGTFEWEDSNYLATLSPDGRKLTLAPSAKIVRAPVRPEPAVPKALLAAGVVAPDFQVEATGGSLVKLSDYRGKVVILKFWATWCGPCIASMPHFEAINQQLKGQDVALLAVCVADDKKPFQDWIAKNSSRFSYPFFYDPAGRQKGIHSELYGVSGIPTVYVIGKDGKVVGNVVGYTDGDRRLEAMLRGQGVKITD